MRLKNKIIIFVLCFLSTAVILGVGALLIFKDFGSNLDVLRDRINEEDGITELTHSVRRMNTAAYGWLESGNPAYRHEFQKQAQRAGKLLSQVEGSLKDQEELSVVKKDIDEMMAYANSAIRASYPIKTEERLFLTSLIYEKERMVLDHMFRLHERSFQTTAMFFENAESTRENLHLYLILLIAFALVSSGGLMIIMRRIVEEPYRVLLDATEKVSSGELSHRIDSTRTDEFGTIFSGFNDMVEAIEKSAEETRRKLTLNELLISVTAISDITTDLRSSLQHVAETVAEKMDKDMCSIMIYNKDLREFEIYGCSYCGADTEPTLSLDNVLVSTVKSTLLPFITDERDAFPRFLAAMSSVMVLPILRDMRCAGIMMIASAEKDGCKRDELDVAMILSQTISATIRSVELHEETKRRLAHQSVLYELSKAMTTLFDSGRLFDTITASAAKLLGARICVIRTLSGGELVTRSYFGPSMGEEFHVPLKEGSGVPGWVAREARPILVDDISKMPDEIRAPFDKATTAIAVPLFRDDAIAGVLSLYDKLDARGVVVPFTLDDLELVQGVALLSSIAIEKVAMIERERLAAIEMNKTEERMRLLFESVQSGIVTLNRDFLILSANRFVERWVDIPASELLLTDARKVFHEKEGICPHCAARATFEDGTINTITQSSGLNYADLTAYPVKDAEGNTVEAIVFIQDITDRVLYQEEIMGLYREVMQTKEYMESLIGNSADAIVTTDLVGKVRSWNPAAEAIYGYRREEAMGRFVPYVPENAVQRELENYAKIRQGEILNIETFRKHKDGYEIEVSMTYSPIKDVSGEIIGISAISRDISDKKRVEKELIRRNQELSRLFFISSAMRGTLDLDRILRMVLTAVTMSDGLGFNRAILFLVDEEHNTLRGSMGVGPANHQEAAQIWSSLSQNHKTIHDLMSDIEEGRNVKETLLDKLGIDIAIPLTEDTVLTRTAREKKPYRVDNLNSGLPVDRILVDRIGTYAYATVPLVSRGKVLGVLWVDNFFNGKPITDEDMKFLSGFTDHVASGIEAARLFQQVYHAEAELENIFGSISDMVYLTAPDYTIKNVNQAVVQRIGIPKEKLIGQKCYKVFHGTDEPWEMCSHHKTVIMRKPYIEEMEDPYLDGTFLSSTAPVFGTGQELVGTVHVVRDITELKNLREKLHAAERMAALGEVAAKVAHEIRNPLVSVGGFAKRLEERLDGGLREYAHIIFTEVNRLEVILKDILGFVREVRMNRQKVNVNEILESVAELLETEIKGRRNKVVMEFFEGQIDVFVDPMRIREAMLNMIVNANQATEGGEIRIRTFREGRMCVLELSDNGCGIQPEDESRIFDPFYTTRTTGTGLGLAVSKRIIEENDGHISIKETGPGEGTTFCVKLPLQEV